MIRNFSNVSHSLDETLVELKRLIHMALNELWLCDFLWSECLSTDTIYLNAKEIVENINKTMTMVHRLRTEKAALVDSDFLSTNVLRLIFEYTEIIVDFSKVDVVNNTFAAILEDGSLSGIEVCEKDYLTSLSESRESIPECGRGGDGTNVTDLMIQSESPNRKRGLDSENKKSPPSKKPRCKENIEHEHESSC